MLLLLMEPPIKLPPPCNKILPVCALKRPLLWLNRTAPTKTVLPVPPICGPYVIIEDKTAVVGVVSAVVVTGQTLVALRVPQSVVVNRGAGASDNRAARPCHPAVVRHYAVDHPIGPAGHDDRAIGGDGDNRVIPIAAPPRSTRH